MTPRFRFGSSEETKCCFPCSDRNPICPGGGEQKCAGEIILEACRELPRQVAAGKLQPGSYQIHGNPDPEAGQFPQLILNLDPLRVEIESNGVVNLTMSPVVLYGVYALPENYEDPPAYPWRTELIDGLWYYDEGFRNHPEHQKEVEKLLKKGSTADLKKG